MCVLACVCVYVNVSVSISMYLCLLVFTFYKIYTFIHLIQIICAADICHNSQDSPSPLPPLHCHLVESNTPSTENSHHIKFVPLFIAAEKDRERAHHLPSVFLSACLPAWPGRDWLVAFVIVFAPSAQGSLRPLERYLFNCKANDLFLFEILLK